MGLILNESKCEVITPATLTSLPAALAGFKQISIQEAVMLGAPLLPGKAMDDVWENHMNSFNMAGARLPLLHAHDALVILKHSLSLPKLLFHLRCTFSGDHPVLTTLDAKLRDMVGHILNIDLSN